jgi:hypothetical protein
MKRLLLLLYFACGTLIATAQYCNGDFLGTKTLYKKPVQPLTAPPTGYTPVFINHVGRHGARHLTRDVASSFAFSLLMKADSAGQLTAQGLNLRHMILALQKAEKGNTKSISAEGKNELEGIGARLYENYPTVFKGSPNVDVRITKEVRTKQSADAFLAGLNKNLKTPVAPEEKVDDVNLRFYDLSPAYKKFEDGVDESEPKLSFNRQLGLGEINKTVSDKFFKPEFLNGLSGSQEDKFVSDILGFATIVYSLEFEIKQAGLTAKDVDFKSFFTCAQLQALSELDSADDYLKKGPGTNNEGIQVKVAVPLLVDFIKTTDEFIKTGKYHARLRFAHAETIAPFAALLQIQGAYETGESINYITKIWQASKVIPLSANIQWVFYKKKGFAGCLVKALLNEKEVNITGLRPQQNHYYSWDALRAFYMKKLARLNVSLNDDMNDYLANLK